ncbi:MAG: polyisoprenoid-binding protein [Bacteriovorax sp.]|nr:polyisoprenoid-binding protein [Rhizobacter sp.]
MKTLLISTLALVAATLAHAESSSYTADPSHTAVLFEAKHFGTSTVRGRFDKKEGNVTLDRAAKTGKAEFTFDTASISTGFAPLDTHLKSKDFFNAAETPNAKFVGDKFSFDGDKVTSVAGTLTMLGKTQPVTLTATNFNCYQSPILKREVCGGDFETTIARSQWGMSYGLTYGLPDSIHLLIQVEAIKQ